MDWKILIVLIVAVVGLLAIKRASFLSAQTAVKLIREGALVIDVRTPGEFESRHITGALNIELGDLKSLAVQRLPDKNKVLLLHCLSGVRSGMGRRQLKSMGYVNVHNLGSYSRAESIVNTARGEVETKGS